MGVLDVQYGGMESVALKLELCLDMWVDGERVLLYYIYEPNCGHAASHLLLMHKVVHDGQSTTRALHDLSLVISDLPTTASLDPLAHIALEHWPYIAHRNLYPRPQCTVCAA